VIGDSLEVIGSAPCYCDKSSYQDCSNIIERYDLLDRLPERVRAVIKKGMAGEIAETPKKQWENVRHFVIGSNFKLLQKAKERAAEYGIPACIVSAQLNGEAREVAKVLTAIGKEIIATGNPFSKPVCLLCGGETTVTVTGNGKGGRNQEMCLAALLEIAGWDTIVFLSAGTDGIDGDSDAAGAVVDSSSYEKAEAQQLAASAYLKRNDSYSFFKQTGDLIQTGPTGTNVMDMTLMLVA